MRSSSRCERGPRRGCRAPSEREERGTKAALSFGGTTAHRGSVPVRVRTTCRTTAAHGRFEPLTPRATAAGRAGAGRPAILGTARESPPRGCAISCASSSGGAGELRWSDNSAAAVHIDERDVVHLAHAGHGERGGVRARVDPPPRAARRERPRSALGNARSKAASTASAAACPWPTAASLADHHVGELQSTGLPPCERRRADRRLDVGECAPPRPRAERRPSARRR